MRIRDFDKHTDLEALRACIIELQDYERCLDSRMPPGSQIVDAYVPEIFDRCTKYRGKVFVAEEGGEIAGYASVLKIRSEELEDGDLEYGLVSDLVVLKRFRNRGIGRALLQAAEEYAIVCQVQWLRIGVLSSNRGARELYASLGFSEYQLQLEKSLAASHEDA